MKSSTLSKPSLQDSFANRLQNDTVSWQHCSCLFPLIEREREGEREGAGYECSV